MIPVADGNENVAALHPTLRARVAALCADPAMRGQLKVDSAVRTYAEQRFLYDGYVAGRPGFNLAANPDRTITPAYGLSAPKGSWHMQQSDGYGYAVDFRTSALSSDVASVLERTAREYLLVRTVPSEDWHYQMSLSDWWTLPSRPVPPAPAKKEFQMVVYRNKVSGAVICCDGTLSYRVEAKDYPAIKAAADVHLEVSAAQFDRIDLARKG